MALDAIVLLGCQVTSGGSPGGAALRRVETAARAYADGVAPLVVASGGRRWGNHVEASVFSRALVRVGVPERAILQELWSFSTTENALFTTLLLGAQGGHPVRLGLVTCGSHMERAIQSFQAAGAHVTPIPAPSRAKLTGRLAERVRLGFDAAAVRRRAVFEQAARFARIGAR